jgi:DNA-binding response OmpR family regulator
MLPSPATHAAIVEDDPHLADHMQEILGMAGWQSQAFRRGRDFLEQQRRRPFDVALLDMRLPDLSGLQVLEQLAQSPSAKNLNTATACIVVTGVIDDTNLENAFALGAQDYVLKPFRSRELIARIGAAHARIHKHGLETQAANSPLQRFGPFLLDTQTRCVYREDQPIALTDKEFGIAHLLFHRMGQTVGREDIRRQVWRVDPDVASRTIDTHVSRVRCKLGLSEGSEFRLSTVYGVGYRLDQPLGHPKVST